MDNKKVKGYKFFNHYVKDLVKDSEITTQEGILLDRANKAIAEIYDMIPEYNKRYLKEILAGF